MTEPTVYQSGGKWYFSCCGRQSDPFDTESEAKTAAKLHKFTHTD